MRSAGEARRFSIEDVSEYEFEVKAKYRVPSVWADLTVSFLPEGMDSTRINIRISVLPNLFTLITRPERRVLARFTQAIGPLDLFSRLTGPGTLLQQPTAATNGPHLARRVWWWGRPQSAGFTRPRGERAG